MYGDRNRYGKNYWRGEGWLEDKKVHVLLEGEGAVGGQGSIVRTIGEGGRGG